MNFFGDKRFWNAIVALIVVVILVAVFWNRSNTMAPSHSSIDKFAGDHDRSSGNNGAKAVTPATR